MCYDERAKSLFARSLAHAILRSDTSREAFLKEANALRKAGACLLGGLDELSYAMRIALGDVGLLLFAPFRSFIQRCGLRAIARLAESQRQLCRR
jgi:hypothetical protein